ncbi:MAG: class I SAM-dependent methyltransferase [Chloroflexota bacterium]
MQLADFRFLRSPKGQTLLAETAVSPITPHNHLQIAQRLRQQLSPAQAHAILETVLLRQKAVGKFEQADKMYFLREALEQASGEGIARYRARRFATLQPQLVADLGCSVGGDALALAEWATVIGVDKEAVRLAMAVENVAAYQGNGRFQPLCADLQTLPPFKVDALFFDPARRDENGRRLFSVQQYRPPLALIDKWREKVGETAVKISPGVAYEELPTDAEVEFISVAGGLKEAVLWYGGLRTTAVRRATLLPGKTTLLPSANTQHDQHSLTNSLHPLDVAVTSPKAYLYEPDAAVIRAHLVEELAVQLNASKIHDSIAYLTADAPQATPFARCFKIEAAFPFQLKNLRHHLRQQKIGSVTIKKRGSPLEPDKLRQQLRLRGPEHRFLFLTHTQEKPIVLIANAHPAN